MPLGKSIRAAGKQRVENILFRFRVMKDNHGIFSKLSTDTEVCIKFMKIKELKVLLGIGNQPVQSHRTETIHLGNLGVILKCGRKEKSRICRDFKSMVLP